jgi:hypothetical protein
LVGVSGFTLSVPRGIWYRPGMQKRMGGSVAAALLFLLGALSFNVAAAQAAMPPTADPAEPAAMAAEAGDDEEVVGELSSTPLGLFSVGVAAGFPSYQTVAIAAAIQAQHVGFQVKGSWTAAGPFIGVQLRAYPPIPIPGPIYVGVGGGSYGSNTTYHAALGAHVPLGKNLRFDVEGGIANVPVLNQRTWAPHLAVGVSYAFPVELGPSGRRAEEVDSGPVELLPPSESCKEPREPDRSMLRGAVEAVIKDWLKSAQATFGSVYTDLSYSYKINPPSIRGNIGHVSVSYRGSVREILTGAKHSASGTASATFGWNGCGWGGGDVEY